MVTKDPLVDLLTVAVGDMAEEPMTRAYALMEFADGEQEDVVQAIVKRIPEARRDALLLGLAFAEAEEALPAGWVLRLYRDDEAPRYSAQAGPRDEPESDDLQIGHWHDTATVALQALTAALRERQS